jgi:hypothetical protein
MFLLRPDAVTNQTFLYCLALAARRYGIEINWVAVESNHYHAGIHDVRGNYPEFLRYFHSLLARGINAHRGRWENLWATEQASVVELVSADAVFEKQIYGLTNPVKDHLVDKVHNWPGVSSLRYQLSRGSVTVKRPKHFFNPNGGLPEEITLQFVRPRGFEHLTEEQWKAKLSNAIADKEREFAAKRAAKGIRLLGSRAVRDQSPFSSPTTFTKRRGLSPRIATRNKWLRVEAAQRNKQFATQYRDALSRFRSGEDVLFPAGTYLLRVRGLVSCEAQPPPN